MRAETTKLVRKLQKGGFRIVKVTEWQSVKGSLRLTLTLGFPDSGQEVMTDYVLRNGQYVVV